MANRVILHEKDLVRLTRNSSKGNQLKWKKDDIWYKADNNGYEGLSEYIVSELLPKTNVDSFVYYNLCQVEYNKFVYNGCSSRDFLADGESLITLPRLFQMYLNVDLIGECERLDHTEEDCLRYIVDNTIDLTGLRDFGAYLTKILEMDMLFLNEDRHLHNIAVIHNEEKDIFRYCPIFDNGGALFSDTKMYYPLDRGLDECREIITARPVSPSFEDQVNAAESLYGKQFRFSFTEKDISRVTQKAFEQGVYPEECISRIQTLLNEQIILHERYQKRNICRDIDYER